MPITLTIRPTVSGTVTNTVSVLYVDPSGASSEHSASDDTIVVAAVPTLSDWAMMALSLLLALAGFVAMRRRAT